MICDFIGHLEIYIIIDRYINRSIVSRLLDLLGFCFCDFKTKNAERICRFKQSWLSEDWAKGWLKEEASSRISALCWKCGIVIDISTMGKGTLKSHMNVKIHKVKWESPLSLEALKPF